MSTLKNETYLKQNYCLFQEVLNICPSKFAKVKRSWCGC